jgi:adenosine/AMP kinase
MRFNACICERVVDRGMLGVCDGSKESEMEWDSDVEMRMSL